MYTEAVDDPKLRLLAFEDRWHFIAILCCKGQGIIDGTRPELLERMLAVKLGVQSRELDDIKRRLIEVGLVDDCWQPTAWGKRQFVSDQDPTNAERQRRYRKRNRNVSSNVTVTLTDTDTDTDKKNIRASVDALPGFNSFWLAYPKKKSKGQAERAWKKLNPDEQLQNRLLQALERAKKTADWQKERGQFIPYPASWLNAKGWEDEDHPTISQGEQFRGVL